MEATEYVGTVRGLTECPRVVGEIRVEKKSVICSKPILSRAKHPY